MSALRVCVGCTERLAVPASPASVLGAPSRAADASKAATDRPPRLSEAGRGEVDDPSRTSNLLRSPTVERARKGPAGQDRRRNQPAREDSGR